MSDNSASIEALAAAINKLANVANIDALATAISKLADAVTGQAGGTAETSKAAVKKPRQEAFVKVSEALSKFVGIEADADITRQEATSLVMKYIKDNDLQDKDDKRNIVPDAALAALLGSADVVKVLNLKSALKEHFSSAA